MATTIRLARHGAKKHPFYRIVVADNRAPRDGRRLEQIGTYDPSTEPARITIHTDKLAKWLQRGARPSLTVSQLLKSNGYLPIPQTPAPDPGEAQT
jgi:small subunit ribosomal protein S16